VCCGNRGQLNLEKNSFMATKMVFAEKEWKISNEKSRYVGIESIINKCLLIWYLHNCFAIMESMSRAKTKQVELC
jgi:hypothetical protein